MPKATGRELIIIDERANDAQREALRKIILGETGEPGSNHFSVFNSTCTEVLEPVYAPINYEIDIENRTASLEVPEMIKATGSTDV